MFFPQFWQNSLFQSKISPHEHMILDLIIFIGFNGLSQISQNLLPLSFICPQTQINFEFSFLKLEPHSMQKSEVISLIVEHVHNIEISAEAP